MKKHFIKVNKLFLGITIGIIISGITVMAATIAASNVIYTNSTSGLSSTNVQGALKELYTKAANRNFSASSYSLSVEGNGLSTPYQSFSIAKSGTQAVTVTPAKNNYIASGSCTNGYTISGLTTGTSATSAQTITVYNNGNAKDGVCTLTLEKGAASVLNCPSCVYLYGSNLQYHSYMSHTLSGYTTYQNYTDLVESTGYNHFLGVQLGSNKVINAVYVCAIESDIPFCIRVYSNNGGTIPSSYTQNNTNTLNQVYNNCRTSYGETQCTGTDYNVTMTVGNGDISAGVYQVSNTRRGCRGQSGNAECGN